MNIFSKKNSNEQRTKDQKCERHSLTLWTAEEMAVKPIHIKLILGNLTVGI